MGRVDNIKGAAFNGLKRCVRRSNGTGHVASVGWFMLEKLTVFKVT